MLASVWLRVQSWTEDPEVYYAEELRLSGMEDYKSRAASIRLLHELMRSHLTQRHATTTVVAFLSHLVAQHPPSSSFPVPQDPAFSASTLQKDAVFAVWSLFRIRVPHNALVRLQ